MKLTRLEVLTLASIGLPTTSGFTGEFRVTGAQAEATEWTCRSADGGMGCGFEGYAVCAVEARQLLTDETCR